jgi:hypothetical protein
MSGAPEERNNYKWIQLTNCYFLLLINRSICAEKGVLYKVEKKKYLHTLLITTISLRASTYRKWKRLTEMNGCLDWQPSKFIVGKDDVAGSGTLGEWQELAALLSFAGPDPLCPSLALGNSTVKTCKKSTIAD